MSGKKKALVVLLLLLIMLATGGGLLYNVKHYHIIDFRLYPRGIEVLDLRDEDISISHYKKIIKAMPNCTVYWNIPFQGKHYDQNASELWVTNLTEKDARDLECFTQLKILHLENCEDYGLLQAVHRTYPELQLDYTLPIGGKSYDWDAQVIQVDGIGEQDLELLQYMTELKQVQLKSGKDSAQLAALYDFCNQRNISVEIVIGGQSYSAATTQLTAEKITEEALSLLNYLPKLRKVHLIDPQAQAQSLQELVQRRTDVAFSWEKEILGTLYSSEETVLDLTAAISPSGAALYEKAKNVSVQGERDPEVYLFPAKLGSLPDMTAQTGQLIAQVEQALEYFPNLERVLLCGSLMDNEAMAAFRDRRREDYKVVWTVQLGDKMIARTDSTYFMPTKFHVYYFLDADAENLKYCEDMICVDLGHMAVSKLDWLSYMPNLQYLVLAHTQVQYIDPISSCKNLKFLELDWSPIRNYTPLKECTALEDLNLGNTYADFTPVGEMTWLKNLWMIGCERGPAYRMTQALTNTKVMVSGDATVANGWRDLLNYYAMRDAMGMYYMKW